MPEDRHLPLLSAVPHDVNEAVEVGDELFDRHGRPRSVLVVRLAAAPLIPVHDRERLLERRVEASEEVAVAREARAPMQKDQHRVGEALAANHHPLIEAA